MDCLYFKTNKFQYWKWFGTGLNAFITLEGTKMNQSIDYVGCYRFPRKNWFHELRRRIECFESQGFFDKMHQSNWKKRI
jgi:hypothetical protein